ncbi:MAG: hypothetical protein U0793_26400 [Gemmataceae bacterium]
MAMTPFGAVFPPLGLLTLAGLTPKDFPITLCDENAGETVDFNVDADIICITGYLLQERNVFEMADRFRALGKLVVLGGPMANLIPQDCRPHCDVLFEGEAEYTWPRFLDDYCAGNHADRYYEEEKIHLPDSPPPRVDILKKKYAHGIVQCSRGCPFTCEFCDIIVMYGRKMRCKTIEHHPGDQEPEPTGTYQVFFADDNFVGNRAYAKDCCAASPSGTTSGSTPCPSTRRPPSTWPATRSCSAFCATPTSTPSSSASSRRASPASPRPRRCRTSASISSKPSTRSSPTTSSSPPA